MQPHKAFFLRGNCFVLGFFGFPDYLVDRFKVSCVRQVQGEESARGDRRYMWHPFEGLGF